MLRFLTAAAVAALFVAPAMADNVYIELHSGYDGVTYAGNTYGGIAYGAGLGYEVISKRLTRDDIYIADEAFFTGTAAEVTPIRELDNRVIGAGKRGPVTEKLQSMFFDVVNGRNPKYAKWLTPIR